MGKSQVNQLGVHDASQQTSDVIGRSVELSALGEFLHAASDHPAAFVIEGEAGIGKTTLWLAALKRADESGFRVLSARVGQSESALPYAAIADLLSGVPPELLTNLPAVQRISLDRLLLRATNEGPPTEQRIVASALVALVRALTEEAPVLVAIDDAQWLDQYSLAVLSFATRRFKRRIGLLVTERLDAEIGSASWLRLAHPDAVDRMRIGPLSLGRLHALISARLGQSLSRPNMMRILESSGGNPFYALELARTLGAPSTGSESVLPASLAELMRRRIGHLDQDSQDVLLAAACVANPSVELLAAATNNTVARITDLLDAPESDRIIEIVGNRVRFAHPLIARSVIADSKPGRRRQIHRALANAIAAPELKARHMALASAGADAETLRALDAAATFARARGAPAAAAELLELTIELGSDTPSRRIRAAEHHFTSGDVNRARTLLESTIDHLRSGPLRSVALNLLAGVRMSDDAFIDATALLKRTLGEAGRHRTILIQTLMSLSFAHALSGEFDVSVQNARQAVVHAEKHGDPDRISQALALLVATSLLNGDDFDQASLQRALALEDPSAQLSIPLCASVVRALVLTSREELDEVRNVIHTVRLRSIDRGIEIAMMPLSCYCALIEIWRGDFVEAAELAQAAIEQADQIGGSRAIALTVRAVVAAHVGRESDARADAAAALTIARQSGSPRLAVWPTMSVGFLEVSLGRYAEALSTFQPLLGTRDTAPGSEITTVLCIPDAVEAMIALGRIADAEPLIEQLERDRTGLFWMATAGARCRSMWLAARGDIVPASRLAHDAIVEHDRLLMPFERARTQLWLGQLQRRQRQKDAARATLSEALQTLEAMGTQLWAGRARDELAHLAVAPTRRLTLTESERHVAQLAASGMTNRDIAARLFISPKTVEAGLARVYRKLGIRTRAELGSHLDAEGAQ